MAKVYLNENEINTLMRLKKVANAEELQVLEKIISKNLQKRVEDNKKASIYKKQKRMENKNFARSKKEIARRVK